MMNNLSSESRAKANVYLSTTNQSSNNEYKQATSIAAIAAALIYIGDAIREHAEITKTKGE